MARIVGVLVAGGAGARLGLGHPKALARLGGETLLERGARTLGAICDEVVIAAPAGLALPLPAVTGGREGPRVARADDPPGASGPLAGVVAGLAARPFEQALVLAVDLPFVTAGALSGLLARLGDHHAVIPAPGGVPQPLAAAYAATAWELLSAQFAAGERSISRAVGYLDVVRLDDRVLAELPGGAKCFFNLNTREDLAAAERRVGAREIAG